jgi:hypothetical protein
LRKKLDGVYTEIQCTDLSEVSHETVLDKVPSIHAGVSNDCLRVNCNKGLNTRSVHCICVDVKSVGHLNSVSSNFSFSFSCQTW